MKEFSIAVKAFIVDDKQQVLLVKRSNDDAHKPGVWEIPGGRLDSEDEDPYDGLKREVKEEVGLEIEIIHPLQIDHFTREDGQKITMLIFLCKYLSGSLNLSHEHSDVSWTPIEKVKDKLVYHFYDSLDSYNKFFRNNI